MGTRIATSGFGHFIASAAGRVTRMVAGLALLILGWLIGDTAGIVVAAIGAVPLLAGALDICLITGLLGGPWTGEGVRNAQVNRAR